MSVRGECVCVCLSVLNFEVKLRCKFHQKRNGDWNRQWRRRKRRGRREEWKPERREEISSGEENRETKTWRREENSKQRPGEEEPIRNPELTANQKAGWSKAWRRCKGSRETHFRCCDSQPAIYWQQGELPARSPCRQGWTGATGPREKEERYKQRKLWTDHVASTTNQSRAEFSHWFGCG